MKTEVSFMKTIRVNTEKPYNIIFSSDPLKTIIEENSDKQIHIVTDTNVAQIISVPKKNNIHLHIIPAGEESKCFSRYKSLCEKILSFSISRNDIIVALGGGVVGDLAGFCAATVLRGIDYIQIPTTLLSMVDSSVGGKTAINTEMGKNLIGAFYQPKAVYINTDFLKTLPKKVYRDGMGEVIKYSLISDVNLNDSEENIIYSCIKTKADIVSKDEKDIGIRKILNYGHTIGHAIEQYYLYEKYTHGEAVAIGMFAASLISDRLNISENLSEYTKNILTEYSLPRKIPKIPENVLENLLSKDKKSTGEYIDFILLAKVGNPITKKLTPKEIISYIYEL